jgi:hypothetical protein
MLDGNQLTGFLPPELGNLSNVYYLLLAGNELAGTIPASFAGLSNVDLFTLSYNHIGGTIPTALSSLGSHVNLEAHGNKLVGEVPVGLDDSGLLWNGLTYQGVPVDDKQTVAPENLTAVAFGEESVKLSWTPIEFAQRPGGYRVFISTNPAGYDLYGETTSKRVSGMLVEGLMPSTTYYFCIRTVTYPHPNNSNTVVSLPSSVVSATTGYIFADGFESGDTFMWTSTEP